MALSLSDREGLAPKQGEEGKMSACHKCGANLIIRTRKDNGQEFYGCSLFPKCKFSMSMTDNAWKGYVAIEDGRHWTVPQEDWPCQEFGDK